MPLHRLYNLTTPSANPSSLSGLLPGGAGVQTAGSTPVPGISAPRLEESVIEVFDCTAPTLLSGAGVAAAAPTPAISGKLLVMNNQGAFGARWVQNSVKNQAIPRGQYGIVFSPAQVADAGTTFATASGNQSNGSKAVVMYDGPIQAYVETQAGGVGISAGQPLTADGAGNLTGFTGTLPDGAVLATYMGPTMTTGISTPQLQNVYVGGY